MDNSFWGDTKASGILAAILTIAVYIIGSVYYYVTDSYNSVSLTFLAIFYGVVFLILLYAARSVKDEVQAEEEQKRKRAIYIQNQKKIQEQDWKAKIEEYDAQYGECTKAFDNPIIRVYEKPSIIIIDNETYGFDEIIGYNLTDNSRIIKGELSSSSSTSNTSTLGRAIVGAAIGGVAGAVIGGATAKKTTEYKQGEDKTIHDYTVNINVNRLSEPLVKLYIGKDEDLANEIAALINAIVVRK